MRYMTVRKFSNESGYTEAAIRSKMGSGVWLKNEVWRHAPDGRVLIDVLGFEAWVELGQVRGNNPVIPPVSQRAREPESIKRAAQSSPFGEMKKIMLIGYRLKRL